MRRLQRSLAIILLFSAVTACNQRAEVRAEQESAAIQSAFDYLQAEHQIPAPREQLVLLDENRDELGQVHLRFQQVHAGIPVYGANIIVHLNSDLSGRHVTGRLVEIPADAATKASVSATQARELALSQACAKTTESPELVFRTDRIDPPRLAYRVPAQKGLLKCDVFVAADEPVVLGIVNRSPSSPIGE